LEHNFRSLNDSYSRLLKWIEERDADLEKSIKDGTHVSGFK